MSAEWPAAGGHGVVSGASPAPPAAPTSTRRVRFADIGTPSPSSSRVPTRDDVDPSAGPRHQTLVLPPAALAEAPVAAAPSAGAAATAVSSSSSAANSSADALTMDLSAATSDEVRRTQLLLAQFAAPEVCADPDDEHEEMSRSSRSYSHSVGGQISLAGTDDGSDLTATPQTQQRVIYHSDEHSLAAPLSRQPTPSPTFAMAPAGKQVSYVNPPDRDTAESTYARSQHESALGFGAAGDGYAPHHQTPMPSRHERNDSSSSFLSCGGYAGIAPPYLHHQRTPSPQPFHPPSIVSFSSRLKGSSVLFAPRGVAAARSRSSSGGSGGPFDADEARRTRGRSPIDFHHHALRNNPLYEPHGHSPSLGNGHGQQGQSGQIALASPAHMLALQLGPTAAATAGSRPYTLQVLNPPDQRRHSSNSSRSNSFQAEMTSLSRDRSGSAIDGTTAAAASNRIGNTGVAIATSVPNTSFLSAGPEPLMRALPNGGGSGGVCGIGSFNGRSLCPLRSNQGVGHVMLPQDDDGPGLTVATASPLDSSASDEPRSGDSALHRERDRMDRDRDSAAATIGLVTPRESTLPLYTRVLRLFLIAVGVVRYCAPERPKLVVLDEGSAGAGADGDMEEEVHRGRRDGGVPVVPGITSRYRDRERDRERTAGRVSAASAALDDDEEDVEAESHPSGPSPRTPDSLAGGHRRRVLARDGRGGRRALCAKLHDRYLRVRSYIYPTVVFLFILTNVFFVTVSDNMGVDNEGSMQKGSTSTSRSYNNWVSLASDFCMNLAPLLSWVGGFYFVGCSSERAYLVFFEQLANLECYTRRSVRNYLCGAAFAGLVLMATTNLTSVDGSSVSGHSFFSLVNVGLFVLLNYLITTFVICALASLICIFHYNSLSIFQEQLYSQEISVVEAIKEHIVLMRLQRESSKYLQYIIFPPLLLYVTGALLAGYNMLSTGVYTHLPATAFQLIMAFVTLMIPLVSGAQITRVCGELAQLATNLDLTNNLVERSSLIQQLVLLPGNAFFVCGIEVNYGLLAKVLYTLAAGMLVLARGASIYSSK